MTDKTILNIVYSPQEGPPQKMFENEDGEIWNSKKKDPNKINIGMGWYSIRNPVKKQGDCLLVVEPYCVLDRDYSIKFANGFSKVFTWATKAFEGKNLRAQLVEINHPSFHSYPSGDEIDTNWKSWDERKNEIVFIANNKTSQHNSELYSLRVQLADMFHKDGTYEVSWYGQIPLKKPYFKGKLGDKQEALTKAKFSVCCENSYDHIYSHGYFSEKLPDAWKSGVMPLYMGCYNVDDFGFFPESYVDLRKYVIKEGAKHKINEAGLLEAMKGITSSDYDSWKERLKSEVIDSPTFKAQISYKKAYETILKSFK